MRRAAVVLSAVAVAFPMTFAAVAAQDASPAAGATVEPDVVVDLMDVSGATVGTAAFTEGADGVVGIDVQVEGLEPGEHGIHLHEIGACDASGDMPFSSAGAHYNPTGAMHDGPPTIAGSAGVVATPAVAENVGGEMGTPSAMMEAQMGTPTGELEGAMASPMAGMGHAGDLGNITIAEDGTGLLKTVNDRFHLADLNDADGSAVLIHADRDDLVTDPSGNSGGRIVCGVIFPPTEGGMATPSA